MATLPEPSRRPQPSNRVPRITAPSWREPTDSTRAYVNFRDGEKCWMCGTHASNVMQVAHQISRCQEYLLLNMRENGTVFRSLTHLAHHRNLILLCPNCHESYNASPMLWCMIPVDDVLERFISHERQNYLQRQTIAASTGISPPRETLESDPSFDITTITYRIYFFDEGFRRSLAVSYYEQPEQKRWPGDPTAAIHKAFQGAFVPWRVKEIDIPVLGRTAWIGMPERTKHLLSELSALWSRPNPLGQNAPALSAIGTRTGYGNESGGSHNVEPEDPRGGNDSYSRSAHNSSCAFDQRVSGTGSENKDIDMEEGFSGSPSLTSAPATSVPHTDVPDVDGWLFGPQYSAADIVKLAGRMEEGT